MAFFNFLAFLALIRQKSHSSLPNLPPKWPLKKALGALKTELSGHHLLQPRDGATVVGKIAKWKMWKIKKS